MTEPTPNMDQTVVLLRNFHAGDAAALNDLIAEHVPFLRQHAVDKLGARLSSDEDPEDIVQSTVRELLQYGPRFLVENGTQFRALLTQLLHRMILHRDRWFSQKRRTMHNEATRAGHSVAQLDAAASPNAHDEEAGMLRLAIEFLSPRDREVLIRRAFDGQSFGEVADELGIGEDEARMRYHRALPRLAQQLRELESGEAIDPSHLE